jgi:phosphoribosylanthranilate isomerase
VNPVIKICGMREPENILAAAGLTPDFMGFIFYPGSPRFAGELLNPDILAQLPTQIRKTGVFVNEGLSGITSTVKKYSLDAVQLHGDETAELCRQIMDMGVQVIKAFSIREANSLALCADFTDSTDYFLFDTMTSNHGGSGQKFDWRMLDGFDPGHPFFLSGGIGPADTDNISGLKNSSLYGIDLNSRFEIEPGLKDTEKLKKFINEIRDKHKEL